MIDRKEDLHFLQDSLAFWKELDKNQQLSLQQSIIKKHFITGEAMHGGSENCSGLFLIYNGQVRTYIISESGREITLYRLFDRDVCIFSASCMMKNIAFDIYVEVEKDTQAFLIPTSFIKNLSSESLPVQKFMNNIMASRFTEVVWIMEQALFTSFDKRLANFLIELSVIDASDILTITHEKIANHLGTAREVVTRMLKYFQNIGLVKLNRGTIQILDRDKLEKLT
jgi:CRP/FNR family transcriptional regulator